MRIMPACLRRLLCGTLCFCLLITLLAGCGGSAVAPPGAGSDTDTEAADTPAGTDTEETESEAAVEPENRLLNGKLSDVLLTTEIPETLYAITGRNVATLPQDEQREIIAEMADILDFEVLWDDYLVGTVDSNELYFHTSDEEGEVSVSDKTIHYFGRTSAAFWLKEVTRVDTITVTEDTDLTISYELDGQEYSIGEAIDYVMRIWDEKLCDYSQFQDIQIFKVLVYQWPDGSYSYVLIMDKLYEGLPFEQYSNVALCSSSENGGFRMSALYVEMDAPEHIMDWMDYYPFETLSAEPLTTDIMTAEEALLLADETFADYASFKVKEMKLCYAARRVDADYKTDEEYNNATYTYTPYWCLVLRWDTSIPGMTNYLANVSLFIDAQTGTAYLADSIDYTGLIIRE